MDWSQLSILGVGLIRSVSGWLENALSDGKIDTFELSALFSTVARTALLSIGLILGFDMEPIAASASAFVVDFVVSKLRK